MRRGAEGLLIVAAFAAIYLIWGSTYLAIRIGLESLPPFLLAGSRFFIAGIVLYLISRVAGQPRPSDSQWWGAAFTGTLMLVCGVGGVTWAEQSVPSGVAALLITTVPMWMTVFDSLVLKCSKMSKRIVVGLSVGMVGMIVLMGPAAGDLNRVDPVGGAVILASAIFWSVGSLRSRTQNLPSSPVMTVAIQMIAAGCVLLVISSVLNEWQDGFVLEEVSTRSLAALAYLAVFGSMISLSAYVWLLRKVSASAVGTYAFVNPLVAVLLGWLIGGEAVGAREWMATTLIVGAVVLIQSKRWAWCRSSKVSEAATTRASEVPQTQVRPETLFPAARPVLTAAVLEKSGCSRTSGECGKRAC